MTELNTNFGTDTITEKYVPWRINNVTKQGATLIDIELDYDNNPIPMKLIGLSSSFSDIGMIVLNNENLSDNFKNTNLYLGWLKDSWYLMLEDKICFKVVLDDQDSIFISPSCKQEVFSTIREWRSTNNVVE